MKKYLILLGTALALRCATPAQAQKMTLAAPLKTGAALSAATQTYYLVLLKAGKESVAADDMEAVATMRAAHMVYLQQLRKEGKLALAGNCPGPVEAQDLQKMYLLRVPTLGEAQALTATDPCVKLGGLTAEVYPWVRQSGAKL